MLSSVSFYSKRYPNVMKDFDLIEHLFKFKDISKLYLLKVKDIYECKIDDTLDGTKIFTSIVSTGKRYLHIRDNKIVGISNGIYQFKHPADFILPRNSEFYTNFFRSMIEMDNEEYLNYIYAQNMKETMLPIYPLPILSYDRLFSGYNFKNVMTSKISKKNVKDRHILNEDERKELKNKLLTTLGPEIYGEILSEVRALFKTHKIMRIGRFTKFITKNTSHPFITIKKFLPLVAFFKKSGPWRRSWIELNYKPEENFTSYKQQVIILNRKNTEICLIDHPYLIFLLEQNKNTYLKETSDENGFLTEKGIDLVNLYFDKPLISNAAEKHDDTNENTNEDTHEDDASSFEVFD